MGVRKMNRIREKAILSVKQFPKVFAILFFLLLVTSNISAEEKENLPVADSAGTFVGSEVPDLAEIVPLEIKLTGRLQNLEKRLDAGLDREQMEGRFVELEKDLTLLEEQLGSLRISEEYKYNKLLDFRETLKQLSNSFAIAVTPVSDSIRNLGKMRKEWQVEATRWENWSETLLKEGEFEQLEITFNHATETIDTALHMVLSKLEAYLTIQERAGLLERKLDLLNSEVVTLLDEERRNTLFNDTPPFFSKQYLAQIKNKSIWEEVSNEVRQISLPSKSLVNQHGWIAILQLIIAIVFTLYVQKRKELFKATDRWRFLALYPMASGLFLSYISCVLLYEYQGVPNSWKFFVTVIGGISFARIMEGVLEDRWKVLFIYCLISIVIITQFMDVMSFPIPLFRLYIFLAALSSLFFCWGLQRKLDKETVSWIYFFLLRSSVCFFGVILVFEIWGRKSLSSFLFVSLLESVATILVFTFFMHMIRGGLEWLFRTKILRGSTALNDEDALTIISRLTRFFDALVILLVIIPAVLLIFGVFQSLKEATLGVLGFGFTIGSNHFTIGLFVIAATVLYCSFLISWVYQKLLVDQVLFKRQMERGARISIARLAHYLIVVIGFLIAISVLGIEITKLTIIISALGVGIGFGLQGIVNNFVCGLVLLFEQPVRVGDIVEIDGIWAEIRHIGIRATVVKDFDHADLIIPNADLVSNKVTNWTLRDKSARMTIKVGVAYGSDVDMVIETLMKCARANSKVSLDPSPEALFLNFGESSLDFELRVFVDARERIRIRSELHKNIDKVFREKKINIAFPQRELHLPEIQITKVEQGAVL